MFCVLIRLESPIQLCGHRLRETVLLIDYGRSVEQVIKNSNGNEVCDHIVEGGA